MNDNAGAVVRVGLGERHKRIESFEPGAAKPALYPEWGKTPYHRVDAARYISAEHVDLEAERLWPYIWQAACREEELPETGDFLEYKITDQSIILVRTASGAIKGYFNACPHRGTQLAKGCGHITQFVCPFHGWRWSLDGINRYVHDRVEFPDLTDEELRLPEAAVEIWGGFVFVRLSSTGPTLAEYLEPVAKDLAPYRIEDYRIKSWRTIVLGANWKVALEAFEEAYHSMGSHPQTMKGNCDVNCSYDTYGPHSRLTAPIGMPSARFKGRVKEQEVLETAIDNLLDIGLADDAERRGLEQLREIPLAEGQTTRTLFQEMAHARLKDFLPDIPIDRHMEDWNYTLFPNLTFNLLPGSIFGFIARPNGGDPDSCIFDVIVLAHPAGEEWPAVERELVTDPDHDWGVVAAQDFSNMELVQQGLHQRTTKFTRLASYQEKRIVNRIAHIDRYYEMYAERRSDDR